MGFKFIKERGTKGITQVSVIKIFYMTPKSIITVVAFRNQTVDMWIPFEIPSKGMQNHNKPRREIFGFVHGEKHT